MNDEKLAKLILEWWEDEQYAESYPGRNKYDDDPDFVKLAKELCDETKN